jgi:hypothetical protein
VKEVVENSVDAGAKVIEIKIKEHGSEGFDVSKNLTFLDLALYITTALTGRR